MISHILNNNIIIMNIIKKTANQSKGRQVKSCMNCPDRNNNLDLLPYKDTNCRM